jgi:diacylglycerol kinase (ATP)
MTWPKGNLKYRVATFREISRFKPYGITCEADGKKWSSSSTLVAVANTPVFGGGLVISPDSSVTDGWLEVVIAEGMSKARLLRVFPKLKEGTHIHCPEIRIEKVKKVKISQSPDGATLPAAFADGELVGSEPLNVTVAPRALKVLGARIP